MRLQRVQIPEFRVLKNIDIIFEKEFVPNIFPLGSQNGGGKSTLLQLIFILLHCSANPERHVFLQNMLYGFTIDKDSVSKTLAIIEIWTGVKVVKLEFTSYKDSAIPEIINNMTPELYLRQYDVPLQFSSFQKILVIQDKIIQIQKEINDLETVINELKIIKTVANLEDKHYLYLQIVDKYSEYIKNTSTKVNITNINLIEKVQTDIQKMLRVSQLNFDKLNEEYNQIKEALEIVSNCLRLENLVYICNYSTNLNSKNDKALLCHIKNLDMSEADSFFNQLSQKVFLAASTTQSFLFFSQGNKKLLFKESNKLSYFSDYYSLIKFAKSRLKGFLIYDFLGVELLIEALKASRDKDFREAIEKGDYGNSYKTLINDVDAILVNKKIKLDADFSGVTFQFDQNGEKVELYPEDLSHGELKRLSIYMWIKYHNIEDAIVLMDEIETAFHPDWQYQIISDLFQWSPSNQYILATHSYELCQALTPAHVKDIEPKLLKQEAKN